MVNIGAMVVAKIEKLSDWVLFFKFILMLLKNLYNADFIQKRSVINRSNCLNNRLSKVSQISGRDAEKTRD